MKSASAFLDEPDKPSAAAFLDEKDAPGFLANRADDAKRLARGTGASGGQAIEGLGTGLDIADRATRDAPPSDAGLVSAIANALVGEPLRKTGRFIRDAATEAYTTDKARDDALLAKVAEGAGSLPVAIASGPAAPLTMAAMMGQGGADDAKASLEARGVTDPEEIQRAQDQAFAVNAPVGAVSEQLLGVPRLLRSVRGMTVGGQSAGARIARQTAANAGREGAQEAIEQLVQNVGARDIVGYDPERDRTAGVGEAALLGALIGAPTGAAFQTAQDLDARIGHDRVKKALDTDQNIPEARKTLLLQQDQLQRGLRPAQMFPKGTEELALPEGMERTETERGVFHFNPEQITAEAIKEASAAGAENIVLGLGPLSKPQVEAVAEATGAAADLTVTERAPDGTEVKATLATPATAPAQAAALEKTKTPGNTVRTEPLARTLSDRLRAADREIEEQAREAKAKEEAARTERQAERDAKKTRFDETLAAARALTADPQADFVRIQAALTPLTEYADDNSLGLTLEQKQAALAEIKRLTPRLEAARPAFEAQQQARTDEAQAKAKADDAAKTQRVRQENERLDAIEATGRDPDTGRIVELARVSDEEFNGLDLTAEGIEEGAYEAEMKRRERATAETGGDAGFTLRDLFVGRKEKLTAAGLAAPLRLPTPATERQRGGLAGELETIQQGSVPWKYFQKDADGLDRLAERLRGLGFAADTEADALDLVARAFGGQDVRPQPVVDTAATPAPPPAPVPATKPETPPATKTEAPARPGRPQLTDQQVSRQWRSLRKVLGSLATEYDVQVGFVADLLEQAGHQREANALRAGRYGNIQAAIAPDLRDRVRELHARRKVVAIAASAARDGKLGGLALHEIAHEFWAMLPAETRSALRALHQRETTTKTGPLYNDGKSITDIAITADELTAERVKADPDLPMKEWFAERVRRMNEDWLAGRMAMTDAPVVVRAWRQLLDLLRRVFAQVRSLDADTDLFTDTFRQWLQTGKRAHIAGQAGAYAQGLLQMDAPLGLGLPADIRNLIPRWQDKVLRFESNLDKALYYAGAEGNTTTRERIRAFITEQTGLTAGQIATQARALRERIRQLATQAATRGEIRVPEVAAEGVQEITGNQFAQASGQSVRVVVDQWKQRGIDAEAYESGDIITLSKIKIPEALQGQGLGTTAMRELIAHADARGMTIALTPSLDFGAKSMARLRSFYGRLGFRENKGRNKDFRTRETMIREPGAKERPDFAQERKTSPRDRVAEIDARLAELREGADQELDAVEAEGETLVAERRTLIEQINEEERAALEAINVRQASELEETASEAARRARHPAAQGTVQPGEAWASVATLTPAQIAAEQQAIGAWLSDNPEASNIDKALLQSRLGALAAETQRRTDPIAAAPHVQSLPKTDRRAALLAELARGRRMRDEGMRTDNDDAAAEGVRLVRQATERLDDEFPGWEKDEKRTSRPGNTEPARRPTPEDDGRNLPPPPPPAITEQAPEPNDEPAPNRGRVAEVFGQSAHQPGLLERGWNRTIKALANFRGSIPELPTFPATRFNQRDRFLKEQGADFYHGIREFWRQLRSGNDYVQRTAEEQVAQVVQPLLRLGGTFRADDYRRLQKLQQRARTDRAEGRLPSPRMLATIRALQSKVEGHPYVLFNRFVLMMDLDWRGRNLKDSQGNPIRLPHGLNATEINDELKRLDALIAGHPQQEAIVKAIEGHRAMVGRIYEDLKERDLFAAQHLQNPWYFPHLTLEIQRGDKTIQRVLEPERVRPGTEADFRSYLVDPVGSVKPIETDYVRAMYYHLVQVGAHNLKADAVRDHVRPYDIRKQVNERAKALSRERGTPVSWEQAYHEEYAPNGYVLYGTDSRDAFPTLQVDRNKLARRLGVELTSEDIHEQLKTLGLQNIRLLPDDLTETLVMGQREVWILPARVAEALRGIHDRQAASETQRGNPMSVMLGMWKRWKLFTPHNHIRYEFNNVVADLEKLISTSPGAFIKMARAAREMRDFYNGGIPSDDLRAALKDGVINAITAQEMGQIQRLRSFDKFEGIGQRIERTVVNRLSSAIPQAIVTTVGTVKVAYNTLRGNGRQTQFQLGLGDLSSVELSAFRESVTRYAHYLHNLERIRNGARPDYAGAYWRDIEAIQESRPGAGDRAQRQAGQISKATFGDYGDLTPAGEWMRRSLVPFYSWIEVNFKYHANLLRNLRDMVTAGEISKAKAAQRAGRALGTAAAVGGSRVAAGILLRLALPYAAVQLWNSIGGPMMGLWDDDDDLEADLSEEDRRRFHILLGRDDDGKVRVMYGNTALADVMKWFGGPKFMEAMTEWLRGETDLPTAVNAWTRDLPADTLNIVAGSTGPVPKIVVAATLRKNVFPDVLEARTIPRYDLRRNIIGQVTDDFTADMIERLANKDYVAPKDTKDWAMQLILQVRKRDPEAWAFYSIKDKAAEFEYQATGARTGFADRDAPDQQVLRNFRRAIYAGDISTASAMYLRLLDLGYTAERFQASVRAQDPLSTLGKQSGLREAFVRSLDADDRAMLAKAYRYYSRMTSTRGAEAHLFPRERFGAYGQAAYQAQPRTQLLNAIMEFQRQTSDEEIARRADEELWRSLAPAR